MTEEWYGPQDITFSRAQMLYFIKNWTSLYDGIWPLDPVGSGYIDVLRRRGKGNPAKSPFAIACEMASEIDIRLNKCGFDGMLVKPHYCLNESMERLAKFAHCSPERIKQKINDVLDYVSGEWPKRRSYKEFVDHRKNIRVGT